MWWGQISVLLADTIVCLSLCSAQQSLPGGTNSDLSTFRKDIDEVALVVSVRDRRGRFVAGLQPEHFRILDNGRAPQRLNFFQRQTDLPLRLAILIDVSDSVSPVFKLEQQAAIRFLRGTIRPDVDRAFIASFNTEVRVVAEASGSLDLLSQAVLHLQTQGRTALLDSLHEAGTRLAGHGGARQRRVIIVISDGRDNSSQRNLAATIESVLRSEAVVYALSTNDEYTFYDGIANRQFSPGDNLLRRVAEATGGAFLRVCRPAELTRAFARIQEELRSQYLLAYTPAQLRRDGAFRSIKVKIRGRRRLAVRCRKGYYAPSDPPR